MPVFDKLSNSVIGAAIDVHKQLGPGFLESIYEQALRSELTERQIPFEAQKEVEIRYNSHVVGVHVLDMLVRETLVVELKAVKQLEEVHYAQVRSYLRAMDLEVGLLMNFNSPTLTVKRITNPKATS